MKLFPSTPSPHCLHIPKVVLPVQICQHYFLSAKVVLAIVLPARGIYNTVTPPGCLAATVQRGGSSGQPKAQIGGFTVCGTHRPHLERSNVPQESQVWDNPLTSATRIHISVWRWMDEVLQKIYIVAVVWTVEAETLSRCLNLWCFAVN